MNQKHLANSKHEQREWSGARVGSMSRPSDLALLLGCVVLALWVHRATLSTYFSPDDLIYLERVQGIVPQSATLWRWLSGVGWFRLLFPIFGAEPFPYMLLNWLLHGAAVAAIYAWVRRAGCGALAATLAAGLFGSSRLFTTVVAQVVTVAEPLAMLLAFAALALARRPGPGALAGAVATFVAALLCKESVMLLPVLLLMPGTAPGGLPARAMRYALLMVPSVLMLAYLSTPAVQAALFHDQAYQRAWGINVFHNLMTMTGWTFDQQSLAPDLLSAISATAWRVYLWVVLGLVALAVAAWRTTTLPAWGMLWWLLTLAPVLPLLTQRYLHYLYIPTAGLAMALGAVFEWVLAGGAGGEASPVRRRAGRAALAWVLAVALLAGHALRSDALIRERATLKLATVDLPVDPFVRKSMTAGRAAAAVRKATAGRRVNAVFVIPELGATPKLAEIFHSILGEGLALKAVCPNLDSVAFVPRWSPAYEDFDVFYGRIDGNVVDVGRGPDAHGRLAVLLITDHFDQDARVSLAAALVAYPTDARLRALYAALMAAPPGASVSTVRRAIPRQ